MMLRFKFCVLFYFIVNLVSAQTYYKIPWATTQPNFKSPLYFEKAQGENVNLYLGYDPPDSGYSVLDYDACFKLKGIVNEVCREYVFIYQYSIILQ